MIFGLGTPSLGDVGSFMIGIAAIYGAIQAALAKKAARAANEKASSAVTKIDEVQKQTNGISHQMQEVARREGRQEKAVEMIADAAAAGIVRRDEALKDARTAVEIARLGAKPDESVNTLPSSKTPIPVLDDEAVATAKRVAAATERIADIAHDEAESKKGD